jgi:sulfite reductase alpha subunit-like flavoprotein
LSGYLTASLSVSIWERPKPVRKLKAREDNIKKVTILYGSQTGNALGWQKCGESLRVMVFSYHFIHE